MVGGLDTLQTLKSPSAVWVASMSDFCFEDEACHVKATIGDGARDVVRVWRIVKEGCNAANKIDPFLYLIMVIILHSRWNQMNIPNGVCFTV